MNLGGPETPHQTEKNDLIADISASRKEIEVLDQKIEEAKAKIRILKKDNEGQIEIIQGLRVKVERAKKWSRLLGHGVRKAEETGNRFQNLARQLVLSNVYRLEHQEKWFPNADNNGLKCAAQVGFKQEKRCHNCHLSINFHRLSYV